MGILFFQFIRQTKKNIRIIEPIDRVKETSKLLPILEEVKEATISIELAEVNKMHLEGLPNIRSFSSGDIVEWPILENVIVNHCPNLKKFGLGKIKQSQIKSVIMENQLQIDIDTKIAYLFELLDEFSTITKYYIRDSEKLDKTIDNLKPSHFTNLLQFEAKNCNEKLIKFLSILIKRSRKLETISIEQCQTLQYLFDVSHHTLKMSKDGDGDEDEDGKYFTKVKELKLKDLYQLTYIWNKDTIRLFSFQNLQMIDIKNCPSLEILFTHSIAKKLRQIKELKLETCVKLDEVVDHGQDDKPTIVKFPTLSKVEFKSLSKLIHFYLHHLEFPSLKTLIIEKCPQMEKFTIGFVTADASSIIDEKCFSELNELKLDSCDKLVYVVSSKTLQELRNLKKLIVTHCKSMKMVFNIHDKIFHSTELLQHLDELILTNLPNLTNIINKEIDMFYQNLQILQVNGCKSLKWLPMSLMLTNMEISNCESLEKIVISNKEEGTRGLTTFSHLKVISLENLTNLSSVFPSTSKFPSLEMLKIANCPTLKIFVEEFNKLKDLPESTTSNYFFPNSVSFTLVF
ncbi:Disease resistance protein RPS2, partial [Mucuna pruriens]